MNEVRSASPFARYRTQRVTTGLYVVIPRVGTPAGVVHVQLRMIPSPGGVEQTHLLSVQVSGAAP
jgi:hypothetical protein